MSNQERFITTEESLLILDRCSYGVLCTSIEGNPYGVPVNYCYVKEENYIFFHCALSGRKMDNIKANKRVSFVVVGFEKVIPQKTTTYYESVMIFGSAEIISGDDERKKELKILCKKYAPDILNTDKVIAKYLPATAIVKIHIEKITGKRSMG